MIPRLQFSLYHKILRVALCVVAFVLIFDSGLFSGVTRSLSSGTQMYLANAVGVYVGVPATEVNTLTAQITKLEQERDLAISEREIAVGLSGQSSQTDTSTFILSIIVFILLVLIITNYALDYGRARARLLKNDNNFLQRA